MHGCASSDPTCLVPASSSSCVPFHLLSRLPHWVTGVRGARTECIHCSKFIIPWVPQSIHHRPPPRSCCAWHCWLPRVWQFLVAFLMGCLLLFPHYIRRGRIDGHVIVVQWRRVLAIIVMLDPRRFCRIRHLWQLTARIQTCYSWGTTLSIFWWRYVPILAPVCWAVASLVAHSSRSKITSYSSAVLVLIFSKM